MFFFILSTSSDWCQWCVIRRSCGVGGVSICIYIDLSECHTQSPHKFGGFLNGNFMELKQFLVQFVFFIVRIFCMLIQVNFNNFRVNFLLSMEFLIHCEVFCGFNFPSWGITAINFTYFTSFDSIYTWIWNGIRIQLNFNSNSIDFELKFEFDWIFTWN